MRLSTSLFTALLRPEKLNQNSDFSKNTRGKRAFFCSPLLVGEGLGVRYSSANFEITGPHGYPSHIILATLSKASPAASS